ncbi:hypothetical protein ACYPKM_01050 [Pseudomonas aeruginosa]
MVSPNYIRDVGQAVAYVTDCYLASVASLAMKAKPSKSDLQRLLIIAQCGVDHVRKRGIEWGSPRLKKLIAAGGNVYEWAAQYGNPQKRSDWGHAYSTDEEVLQYLLDCTLATVEMLAERTRASKSAVSIQVSIAETAYAWLKTAKPDIKSSRISEVQKHDGSVQKWFESMKRPAATPSP